MGGGGAINGDDFILRRCIFQGNRAGRQGGAVYAPRLHVEDCVFIGNAAPHGAAVYLDGDGRITRSTFYRNDCLGEVGGAIAIGSDHFNMIPDHCIIAETIGASIECPMPATPLCCDVWGNSMDDDPDPWCGFDPRLGIFSEDPLFCDPERGDFGLLENSPCLPGNHGGQECGRIGAGAEFCGIIRTSETTWGRVKMLWR